MKRCLSFGAAALATCFAVLEATNAATIEVSSRAEASLSMGTGSPRPVVASEASDGDFGAVAAVSAGTIGVSTAISVTLDDSLARFAHDGAVSVSDRTFDAGWRRYAKSGFTYVAPADGVMEYTWDVSFAKDYWTVAGGYSLCASDPCSGSIWSLYDSSTALGGSRHTGNGSFALTAGETYHFTLYEGMSSDGYQAPQGTSSSARLALSFPTSVVPLPSAALLFGAAIAALAHWRRRPSVA